MSERINKWLFMGIATLVAMIDMGVAFSFGAYFIDIMDTFQTDRSGAATVQSLLIGFIFSFGVASGALVSKLGIPLVTLISSVLVMVGFCASFFATSVVFLYVSISIVAGTGISMAYISCVVVVSRIFQAKQKLMCIALLSTSTSVGGLCYPYLIDLMNENYGIHGALFIQGGLTCNNFALFVLCWVNKSNMRNGENNHIPNNRQYNETSYVLSDMHENIVSTERRSILEHLKILTTFKFAISSLYFLIVYAAFGCLGQIVVYVANGYVLYEVGTAMCGVALGGIVSSSLVLVVELVHHEQFPVASGLMNTLIGVITAGSGYGLGAFRDYSGSYNVVLVIVGVLLGIAAVLFSFGFISNCRKLSPKDLQEDRERDPQWDSHEDRHSSASIVSVTKL